MFNNSPTLWKDKIPRIQPDYSKYDRGHAVILGGNILSGSTGAAKLAAYAALRSGAGLVSIITDEDTAQIYAASVMSIMVKISNNLTSFKNIIQNEHVKSVLIGPGAGVNNDVKDKVLTSLSLNKPTIIDAEAITIFENSPEELFNSIKSDVIITPHEGEFKRLFNLSDDKISSTINAAKKSGATVLLKGHKTIISSKQGEYIIHESPSNLSTAGTGDVLAGIITGLMAQGVDSFHAAAIGCYIHSSAAKMIGKGLIAEDLLTKIASVLQDL